MAVVAVIPARIDSQRLYGKMLLKETGKPLIQYAWEAAQQAETIDRVVIATDSHRISEAARGFGAEVVETGKHSCGSDRCEDAIQQIGGASMVVNLQGDEPEIKPEHLDRLVCGLRADRGGADMATLMTKFRSWGDVLTKDCVKVVTDSRDYALYFSRSAIPHMDGVGCDSVSSSPFRLHVGVYAFYGDYLIDYSHLPKTPLSAAEGLEQLRALEGGARIVCVEVDSSAVGIDTRGDYLKFVSRCGGGNSVHP